MASESSATTVWHGGLAEGSGTATVASGAIPGVGVSWPARVERTEGTTAPEELLAAAHSACYCMALSHVLDQAGHEPERLETTAKVEFVPGEGVKSSHLTVGGAVADIDQSAFAGYANEAHENCPISGALRGNVEMSVDATLE